jgi:hypothetical protein
MKTSELIGAQLDWAVATCEGWKRELCYLNTEYPNYSTNWSQGGPIIEREGIDILFRAERVLAYATTQIYCDGPTPLIAAMRCYVASKMGEDVDIPEELK